MLLTAPNSATIHIPAWPGCTTSRTSFYTPRNGGHWVVIGEQAAREIVSLPEIFSANLPRFDRTVQPAMPYVVPLHADPPDHTMHRKVLAPLFTAAAVRQHEVRVRAVAQGLVAAVAAAGQRDSLVDIAQRFHVGAFTRMVSPQSFAEASVALAGVGCIDARSALLH